MWELYFHFNLKSIKKSKKIANIAIKNKELCKEFARFANIANIVFN